MIDVIDNFLPEEEFKQLQQFVLGASFPWYYKPSRDYDDDGKYHLVHVVYSNNNWLNDRNIVEPFMFRLHPLALIRIKFNQTLAESQVYPDEWHVDYTECKNHTTCVYYINTNDGYTEFKDGTKIESVENRLLKFPCYMKHRGTTSTERRVVMNINYMEWK